MCSDDEWKPVRSNIKSWACTKIYISQLCTHKISQRLMVILCNVNFHMDKICATGWNNILIFICKKKPSFTTCSFSMKIDVVLNKIVHSTINFMWMNLKSSHPLFSFIVLIGGFSRMNKITWNNPLIVFPQQKNRIFPFAKNWVSSLAAIVELIGIQNFFSLWVRFKANKSYLMWCKLIFKWPFSSLNGD